MKYSARLFGQCVGSFSTLLTGPIASANNSRGRSPQRRTSEFVNEQRTNLTGLKSRYFKTQTYGEHGDTYSLTVPRWTQDTAFYANMPTESRYVLHRSQYHKKYADVRVSADKRDIPFNLSFEQFKEMMLTPCFYCGCHAQIVEGKGLVLHGVDRVDNDAGYDDWNCVACCWECNRSKCDSDLYEFLDRCEKITMRKYDIIQSANDKLMQKEYVRTTPLSDVV